MLCLCSGSFQYLKEFIPLINKLSIFGGVGVYYRAFQSFSTLSGDR